MTTIIDIQPTDDGATSLTAIETNFSNLNAGKSEVGACYTKAEADAAFVENSQIDTDGTLAANSDDKIASQKATKTYADVINTRLSNEITDSFFDFVASGCVWSGDAYGSTRVASMTAGVVYIGGVRVALSAVTSRTFTASKDTYIDVDNTGTITYAEVTNNAASPALAANSIRLGIIVTGASNIANAGSVNQGQGTMVLPIASSIAYSVTDSLGNLICPRDPNRKILGYRQAGGGTTTTVGSEIDVVGLSVPVIVPTGRKIKITSKLTYLGSSGGAGTAVYQAINEGATNIGRAQGTNGQNAQASPELSALTTPSAGLHTYKTVVFQNGAGTLSFGLGSLPYASFIMVELV